MGRTKIEWADKTWNPVCGCSKISAGCANCYAERLAKRFAKPWGLDEENPFRVMWRENELGRRLHWRKPSRIFVCSMGDLFHEDVRDEWLDEIFGVILACSIFNNFNHIFMILTKRPERMQKYLSERSPVNIVKAWTNASSWIYTDNEDVLFSELVESAVCHDWDEQGRNSSGSTYKPWGYMHQVFPLKNLWIGVTTENQATANLRVPILLDTPAEKHFVSVEPMLGLVDLSFTVQVDHPANEGYGIDAITALDWVICGGESGHGARPMHPNWARNLRDQCSVNFVPFLFKQWGEWALDPGDQPIAALMDKNRHGMWIEDDVWRIGEGPYSRYENLMGTAMYRVGKKNAGRLLDGEVWDLYPNGIKNHKTEVNSSEA